MGRRSGRDATKRSNARTQTARVRAGRPGKVKVCHFCAVRAVWVDYKDVVTLRRLMSDRGKIKARRVTGTCRQHQRDVAVAIKTARELALLPYALSPNAEKSGRNGRPRGPQPAERTEPATDTTTIESDDSDTADSLPVEDDEQESPTIAVVPATTSASSDPATTLP